MTYTISDSCTGCGRCQKACTHGAITRTDDGRYKIAQSACIGCGACAEVCGHNAVCVAVSINSTVTMRKSVMQNFRMRRRGR